MKGEESHERRLQYQLRRSTETRSRWWRRWWRWPEARRWRRGRWRRSASWRRRRRRRPATWMRWSRRRWRRRPCVILQFVRQGSRARVRLFSLHLDEEGAITAAVFAVIERAIGGREEIVVLSDARCRRCSDRH